MTKKISNKLGRLIALVLAVAFAGAFCLACGGKIPTKGSNADNVLDVYIYKAGYGTSWLDAVEKEFKKEQWVKDIYGDVTINVTVNDIVTYTTDRITNGSPYDLYFGMNLRPLFLEDYKRNPLLEDLTYVFDTAVPGEAVLFKDKMMPTAVESGKFTDSKGKQVYYSVPWSGGMNGIYYNNEILQKYSLGVPLTTNQLISACDTITSGEGYAIMSSSTQAPYWQYMYPTFWSQFGGYEKFTEYYNGMANGVMGKTGKDVLAAQEGIPKSLKALEKILGNKHVIDTANSITYMAAQTNFIKGQGAFLACGDWLDSEMKSEREARIAAGQILPTLGMMRTPIVSEIVEKLEYRDGANFMSDEMLANLIKDVDNNLETPTDITVTQKDYDTVREARRIVHSVGYGMNAVVPSYSPAKSLAKDFLRYLATDKANDIYCENTEGSQLPFKYDLKSKNPVLYNSTTPTAKMRFDFYSDTEKFAANILPSEYQFPLMIYSAYSALPGSSMTFEIYFGSKDDKKSADKLYQDALNYWTQARWDQALADAMLD